MTVSLFTLSFLLGLVAAQLPPIHHGWYYPDDYDHEAVTNDLMDWHPDDVGNQWELSGLKEGDIMELPDEYDENHRGRNVVRSNKINWPNGVIPFILQPGMNKGEKRAVQKGMDWITQNSCIRFRPYRDGDPDYVHIMYNLTGCWGHVGRLGGGQVISLQRHACFIPGTVAHELLHATGFHHQQSASDRDEYVHINFTNVKPGKEHQFVKYSAREVTDFGVGYDYSSLMHYSRTAFSKNGQDTIIPYEPGVEIGQKRFISNKDIEKLNRKYKCKKQRSARSL
ncbi:zinc metalloproteinase nas-14-like [Neocloeon triangulifer]|uniref:zinc metalloproteinase nas-14-like n=1 Tax=Neocloeon triangulifer TaxID=2078957 RepID=UPI00286F96EE|nr:zinc metalloproteinase nas-14-like [Neocloeon triangulifer]